MEELENGYMYICRQGDEYADNTIRVNATRLGLRLRTVEGTVRELSGLRREGLFEPPSLVKVEVDKYTKEVGNMLREVSLKRRIIVLEVKDMDAQKALSRVVHKRTGIRPIVMLNYPEWTDKYDYCSILIDSVGGLQFDSDNTKNLLIKLMIRNPESWKELTVISDSYSSDYKIKLTDLQDIFPDIDFNSLDDFLSRIIQGKTPRKTISIYSYYRDIKEYSTVWLWKKLLEQMEVVMVVYEGYKLGVIHPGIYRDIPERAKAVGMATVDTLLNYREKDYDKAFRIIRDLPYEYFYDVQHIIYKQKDKIVDDYEFVGVITEIMELRKSYNEKQKETKALK